MDTCCIAVDDVGPSPIVESCPASPLFDSVARWEFEAVNWQQEWTHFVDILTEGPSFCFMMFW